MYKIEYDCIKTNLVDLTATIQFLTFNTETRNYRKEIKCRLFHIFQPLFSYFTDMYFITKLFLLQSYESLLVFLHLTVTSNKTNNTFMYLDISFSKFC